MAKMIKFDLPIDGVKVATLDDLRDHFTTETIGHFRSGLLARWLRSRSMTRELEAVEALTAGDDTAVLKELCRIFEVEADDDAITASVAKATGVPGIRPGQVQRKRARNPGDTFRDCPECPELVVVPAGSFMMGSPDGEEDRRDGEGPLHEVRIDYPLAVGVYTVTFDEWDACVSDGGCGRYRPGDNGWGPGSPSGHQRELGRCAKVREVAVLEDGEGVSVVERVRVGVRGASGDEDAILVGG